MGDQVQRPSGIPKYVSNSGNGSLPSFVKNPIAFGESPKPYAICALAPEPHLDGRFSRMIERRGGSGVSFREITAVGI